MTSPRFATDGIVISARAISVPPGRSEGTESPPGEQRTQRAWGSHLSALDAGGERDDHVDAVLPERAVAELRDGDELLRGRQPDAGGDARPAGARTEREDDDVALRIALVENRDRLDVLGRRHRALDIDGDRHRV